MRISDQSNVTPQLALPVPSLTISSERDNPSAPTHPSNETGYHTHEDPSLPNYEDAMAMRMGMECMRNTSTLPANVV